MTRFGHTNLFIRLMLVSGATLCAIGCSGSDVNPAEGNSKEQAGNRDSEDEKGGSSDRGGATGVSGKGGSSQTSSEGSNRAGNAQGGSSGTGGSNRGGAAGRVQSSAGGSEGLGGDEPVTSNTGGRRVGGFGRGGSAGSGSGSVGRGGVTGTGGSTGPAGQGGAVAAGGATGTGGQAGTGGSPDVSGLEPFSFFVTSLKAIQRLSGSQKGFGGDLRFGKADGLSGADEICRQVAETSMPGSGAKQWRAFLSVTKGPDGTPINAIDRVGEGPWYDRLGRLVAQTKADLQQTRPNGADPQILNDLPNEDGVPNHAPDASGQVDNHDTLTGSDAQGKLYNSNWSCTCHDWTSSVGTDGKPRVGHTWPRSGMGGGMGGGTMGSMAHWISALDEAGCGAGINLIETGPPDPSNPTVGSGGGYGGFYCLALSP